jgi:hypothetical protein
VREIRKDLQTKFSGNTEHTCKAREKMRRRQSPFRMAGWGSVDDAAKKKKKLRITARRSRLQGGMECNKKEVHAPAGRAASFTPSSPRRNTPEK